MRSLDFGKTGQQSVFFFWFPGLTGRSTTTAGFGCFSCLGLGVRGCDGFVSWIGSRGCTCSEIMLLDILDMLVCWGSLWDLGLDGDLDFVHLAALVWHVGTVVWETGCWGLGETGESGRE